MRYSFFCAILVLLQSCFAQKPSATSSTGETPCQIPSQEEALAVPVDTIFCRYSNGLKQNTKATGLWIAAIEDEKDWVRAEIQRGANVNALDSLNISTPLIVSVLNGNTGIVQLLLKHGADPNTSLNNDGKTPASTGTNPLLIAVDRGNYEIAKLLLEHGADPNKPRSDNGLTGASDGSTPLILAAQDGYREVVQLLLEHGADPDIPSSGNGLTKASDGATPLILAVEFEHIEVVQLLFDHNADPNILAMRDGGTPLMLAAIRNSLKIARLLLEHGADVNQVNTHSGSQPLDYAQESAMVELLEKYGAYTSLKASMDKLGKRGH